MDAKRFRRVTSDDPIVVCDLVAVSQKSLLICRSFRVRNVYLFELVCQEVSERGERKRVGSPRSSIESSEVGDARAVVAYMTNRNRSTGGIR